MPALGFDIDHTLCIDNKLERVAFLRLLELIVDAGGRVLGTLDDEIKAIDELLVLQRGGAFSIDEAVRRFVSERGLEPKDDYVNRYRDMAVTMVDEFVVPLPGAKKTLAQLRDRGVPIAVLSNGWNPLQQRKADRIGFPGPVLVSADLGVQKPDPRAFEALVQALGTRPRDVWYVGDDPRNDVAGARNAGLRAVWLDAEGMPYPADLERPPVVISSLEELLSLLSDPVHR